MAGKRCKPSSTNNSARKLAAVGIIGVGGTLVPLALVGKASAAPVSAWDRVAACESNGRWSLPWGDADSTGGLQIQDRTWWGYGGQVYAQHAYQASKAHQIMIAEKILAAQGPSAWSCVTGPTWTNVAIGALQSSGPNSSHLSGRGGINPYPPLPAPVPLPVPHPKPIPHPRPIHHRPAPGARTYTVVKGDWLCKIARHQYGDWRLWHKIYDANRHVIGGNPNLILPGQVLTIPR